jgi:hypothetical protein
MSASAGRDLSAESIGVVDSAYDNYKWSNALNKSESISATWQKRGALDHVVERHNVFKGKRLTSDQIIVVTGSNAGKCPVGLRCIGYCNPEAGKH